MTLLAHLLVAFTLSSSSAQEPNGKPPASSETTATSATNATPARTSLIAPDIDLIDVPTAAVLDHGGFSNRTRFFSNGGVVDWLSFGVYPRFNIGGSLNVDQLLGTATPARITRPELQAKYRLYDGERHLPALTMGFDNQGYLYNRSAATYNQRQRGLYFVGSQEIVFPELSGHAGINLSDFDTSYVFGFFGVSLRVMDKVLLMAEWDNIRNYVDSRVNMGLRFYVTPTFTFDFAGRGIGQGGTFSDGTSRGAERIVQFKYIGTF